ncbi:S8 family serine peptidase [Nonomuraea sp. NPDC005650]|uniref:S8 family peptidase n=1 Tax=Nonomuraea sp. NPDC005650 TaxID=3157045 RepID=UPI0033B67901
MRKLISLATVATATAALLVVSAPSHAEPSPAPPSQSGQPVSTHRLTLLTGDVVTVRTFADGQRGVTADPAGPSRGGVSVYRWEGDLYAVPLAAQEELNSGAVDEAVFDVDELIRSGYDDASASSIPVVLGNSGKGDAPAAPAKARARHTLESIDALAVTVRKADTRSFWKSHDTPAERRSAGIGKIWLDRRITVDLAESVPQIGAPAAWSAGYDGKGVKVAVLDTGVDDTHPDLAGRVTAARNFTTAADAKDHFGHGTHVAATIGGSGTGNGAKGVAPGAELINGKVLDDTGSGQMSDIIDGMEWAAGSGAAVVNMSLGSDAQDDGKGPLSVAVNTLTQRTGALFVVAAGNAGRPAIGSPASADEALTVGAVDRAEALAPFSTRGPRIGDFGVKPELSAPGVNIVAARAAGTSMGTPVDERYTRASGTSMATPHVAGAVALLKQQHPDWTARQLKAALVTSATAGAYQVAQGGVGRVDVARAVSQQAYGTPPSLSLGAVRFAETYQPVTREVTIHNDADQARTFALEAAWTNAAGTAMPQSAVSFDDPSVTVPAKGTATFTVSVDPNGLTRDTYYSGRVTATAQDAVLRFPFSFQMEPLLYDVAVTGIGRDGVAAGGPSQVILFSETQSTLLSYRVSFGDGVARARVRPGTYTMQSVIYTPDAARSWIDDVTAAYRPSIVVDRDVAITLDARQAREVTVDADRPVERMGGALAYYRTWQQNGRGLTWDWTTLISPDVKHWYAFPSPAAANGSQEIAIQSTLTAPPLTATVEGRRPIRLNPTRLDGAKPFEGRRTLEVLYAGTGADYPAKRARGKLVLVKHSSDVPISEVIDRAAARGAAAVAVMNEQPGRLVATAGSTALPAFALTGEEGARLSALAGRGEAEVALYGVPYSPYQYDLVNSFTGTVPEGELRFAADATNTAKITAGHYAHAQPTGRLLQASKRSWAYIYAATETPIRFGGSHEEWVSADPNTRYQTGVAFDGSGYAMFERTWHSFTPGARLTTEWFKQVTTPRDYGITQSYSSVRGDYLSLGAQPWPDIDPTHLSLGDYTDRSTVVLYQGDTEVGRWPYSSVSPGIGADPASYRAVLTAERTVPGWTFSAKSTTTWTFATTGRKTSSTPISMPQISYDVAVGLDNRVRAGRRLAITVHATDSTQASTWVSVDDGASWQPVRLTPTATAGVFTTTVDLPRAERTSGYVSLRTQAADASGHQVDQTVERAFGLK